MGIKDDHLNINIKLRKPCYEIHAWNSVMSIDLFWKKKSSQKYSQVAMLWVMWPPILTVSPPLLVEVIRPWLSCTEVRSIYCGFEINPCGGNWKTFYSWKRTEELRRAWFSTEIKMAAWNSTPWGQYPPTVLKELGW